jgi:GDP-L-fucose synthase
MGSDSRLAKSGVYVAGHTGLAGSAVVRRLRQGGCNRLLARTHAELDLTDQTAVFQFFAEQRPDCVFLAAAKAGGILAHKMQPAEFISDNLAIQTNVIQAAHRFGAKRLLFIGSSAMYPRDCPQPIREEYLLTGPPDPAHRGYAAAKIAGLEMCWAFNRQYKTQYITVMPTNLYGPNDKYDPSTSHVLAALLRKVHEAKATGAEEVTIWGTGAPRRELLHSDDMADACVFLMNLPDDALDSLAQSEAPGPFFNLGCGEDLTIAELAEMIVDIVGFRGRLVCDRSKPDGTMRKVLDVSWLKALGWQPRIPLREGIESVYREFLTTHS